LQNDGNVFHFIRIMSLHYLVKLEIFIAHVRDITKKTFCSLFPSHTVYVRDQHPYREHEKWCKLPSMGPGGVPAEMHFSEFGAHETRLVAANVFVSDERNLKIEILRGNRYTSR